MSSTHETRLVAGETSVLEGASAVVAGLGFLTFLFAWLTLSEVVSLETRVLGMGLFELLGLDLLVSGSGVLAFGVVSRAEFVETSPSDTAGLPAAIVFGSIGLAAGGIVASQTFGFGFPGWLAIGVLTGGASAAVTILPREDIGSTVPAGVLAVAVGAVFLTGLIGPEWAWNPADFEATYTARVVVPVLAVLCSLLVAWASAKAYSGFGSRGRQNGAYFLIGVNAFAMLAVPLLLLAFVVRRGWPRATAGIEIGPGVGPTVVFGLRLPFDWPFVMNVSQGIYVDVPGVLPAIAGTAWLVIGAMLFAVPLGVGAAVFLTEYAEQGRFTSLVEVTTNGLWSTPSIVFGLFGLAFLVPRFGNTNSLFVGMVVLGFMLLPLVLITSREALKSVPDEYRDASAALGVSQWETIKSVVLPAALPGVITGVYSRGRPDRGRDRADPARHRRIVVSQPHATGARLVSVQHDAAVRHQRRAAHCRQRASVPVVRDHHCRRRCGRRPSVRLGDGVRTVAHRAFVLCGRDRVTNVLQEATTP